VDTKTVTIQIGNSDNKLPQVAWSSFTQKLHKVASVYGTEIHFFGVSAGDAPWQNCCVVLNVHGRHLDSLRMALKELALAFSQDSIAMTLGDTEFVAFEAVTDA
jgi:hypothetical protein